VNNTGNKKGSIMK